MTNNPFEKNTPTILIDGTWGEKESRSWIDDGSGFVVEALIHGVNVIDLKEPFLWSTALDGYSPKFWKKNHNHMVWASWGRALLYYAHWKAPGVPVNLIAHSHGGQVAAYALNYGLKVNQLITIATPVRADMAKIWTAGRPNVKSHLHIHTGKRDMMQWLGELGDGRFGIYRRMAPPAHNHEHKGHTHSSLLHPGLWSRNKYWDLINGQG